MEEFLSFETLIIVVTTLFHLCGMYKLGPFLTKFCVNDVKTGNKVLKIIKLDSQLMKGGGVIYVGIFFFRLSGAPWGTSPLMWGGFPKIHGVTVGADILISGIHFT